MMLSDRYLDAFYMVAQTGSFSVAADRLYLSKATVIQHINTLENWLGFTLFFRSNKGAEITPEGQYFMREVKKMQRNIDPVIHRCRMMQVQNVVRIGTLPNFKVVILPEICHRFKELYPDIEIQFVERPLKSYFHSFESGQFNITAEYMTEYTEGRSSYSFHKLMDDKFCCGVPKNHPLHDNQNITLNDLVGQRMMMYTKRADHEVDCFREYVGKNVTNFSIIDLKTYDSSLTLECELTQSLLLVPSLYVSSFPGLKRIPFDIGKDFHVSLGFGYHTDGGPAVLKFMDVVKEMFPTKE